MPRVSRRSPISERSYQLFGLGLGRVQGFEALVLGQCEGGAAACATFGLENGTERNSSAHLCFHIFAGAALAKGRAPS